MGFDQFQQIEDLQGKLAVANNKIEDYKNEIRSLKSVTLDQSKSLIKNN